ncbi:hypothetical protein [Fluviicola chungangensis]|uniref:Uncharacterized protein n=1 Tax=Fluviicola chungangensis TaxID=2597671 RepID=A0A556MJS1_9FLAO|nr:hypothetical protein [Fluviicola chungangensis]TSJ40150.1 hypothetical protein FO442_16255 [Fluviicola chungangensis]
MSIRVETEQTYGIRDRKIAGIIAFTAFVLLAALLGFIGYRISNQSLPKQTASEKMTLIPLNPQVLEQMQKNGRSGSPAKTTEAKTTPAQTEQLLAAAHSSEHVKSGNSNITNTSAPNNNPSGAKYLSDNPFTSGGINGGKYREKDPIGMHDDQIDDPKPVNNLRQLISLPNTSAIVSDENCRILLSVLVDPDGNIIGNPTLVKSASTTTDMSLIKEVISVVKNQAKYNKVKTTTNMKLALSIRITAS